MLKKKEYKEKLIDIGEKEILHRLKKYMDNGQIEDDTAIIKASEKELIINTDILVEDIHFSYSTSSPRDIGWKAVTVNLSDLACSGIEDIIGITIGLVVPPNTPWQWVENTYKGIKAALDEFGGKILGGDCSQGSKKVLSVTAIGTKGPLDLHRSNAKPGDYLVASGAHGLSRLGLGLLLSEPITKSIVLPNSLKQQAIQAHQKPIPPLEALKSLIRTKPSNLPWSAAATDSSDGLVEAIESLCLSSNCSAILQRENLPIHRNWPLGKKWEEFCLEGGEDFELIVSLDPNWAKAWVKSMPSARIIGQISKGPSKILWSNGDEITTNSKIKFNHF